MTILLTGSSSGIGRALAEHLLGRGHQVWGLARSDQSAFAAAHQGFHFSRCDVADWEQVAQTASAVAAAWPHLDAIITCAGVHGEVGPAFAADPRHWSETVRANLDGTYYTLRAFHALLQKAPRRAKIVCFSGGGATKARANFSAYAVAKTGIVRLVENLADESRGQPLDINALAPGAINTRLTDEIIAMGPALAGEAEYAGAIKQKQTGGASLQRVNEVVEFLLSEKSDGITGRLLSAPWDPFGSLPQQIAALQSSDVYTLRRIIPEERGLKF